MSDPTGLRLPGFLEIDLEEDAVTVTHQAWSGDGVEGGADAREHPADRPARARTANEGGAGCPRVTFPVALDR